MLTPYIKPEAINGGIGPLSGLGKALYSTGDALDKRNESSWAQTVQIIDAARDVAETTANALGIRSPYYIIGEIPNNNEPRSIWSNYQKSAYGIVRAVSSAANYWTTEQRGVIIDCLGDINADISVEFTSRPLFYQSSSIMDSRVRKPVIIRAIVAVSNYLNDDGVGSALSAAAQLDASGALELARDNLLYEGNTRAQYALYMLRSLQEKGKPFIVYTPHGYYENMLIQSIKPQTNENSLDMLYCEIVFQEAILAAPYLTKAELQNRTPTRNVITPKDSLSRLSDNMSKMYNKVLNWF